MKTFSANALSILENRYLRKNSMGVVIETPDEMFQRVAKEIAKAELYFDPTNKLGELIWEKRFYDLLSKGDFLPNSPTLMNAGNGSNQLSACFVLPIENDLNSIFETLKNTAAIQHSGGGTGFNFSKLASESDYNEQKGLKEIDVISVLKIFNSTTDQIKQGGKRRGANMGILNVWHPDIIRFIRLKRHTELANFNLSVGITDDFMRALEQNLDWPLRHPQSQKTVSLIKAREIWDEILLSVRETGDPGLLFLDEINRHNPLPNLGKIEATNPCGEVPLMSNEACNLGSINLSNMLKHVLDKHEIDWQKLEQTTVRGIRFLDNIIDVNDYPVATVAEKVMGNRKIGLGVMGWAEMLIMLRIPYNSREAVNLAEKLMAFIDKVSLSTSAKLAKERGTFPNWEKSIYYPDKPLRNATRTAIAPTGTISTLANTSFSIEPLFALIYERRHILGDQTHLEINPLFYRYLLKNNNKSHALLHEQLLKGDEALLDFLDDELKPCFPTALNISFEYHIRHQIAFQKHTDNAVSKTINLPEFSTTEDISNAFKMAWKQGAKGLTIYRYNSKRKQVLNIQDSSQVCFCD